MHDLQEDNPGYSPSLGVVHVFSSLAKGGAESRTLELIQWLTESSAKVHVTVFEVGQPGEMAASFRNAGATVITQRFRSRAFWSRFARALRQPSVMALHLHVKRGITRPAVLLPIAKLAGVPTRVVHFRSDGTHATKHFISRMSERLNYALIDSLATDIVGVSPASLERGWSSSWTSDPRCRVMMSGLSLSPFASLTRSGRLRGLIPSQEGDVIIVHVGRDTPVKNRQRAVEVLSTLDDPRFHLVFIGRNATDATRSLVELSAALGLDGRVHHLGERNDVPQLMADADLTLLTSTHEGLPGVVLESLAAGTPVVATDLPGTRFIADALDHVLLVPLDNDLSWGDAIRHSVDPEMRNTRSEISEPLRGSAFDLDAAAEEFVSLWTRRRR